MRYPVFHFTATEQRHCQLQSKFKMQTPSAFCAFCLQLLYPEQVYTQEHSPDNHSLPCYEWNFLPIRLEGNLNMIVVCESRYKKKATCVILEYCGPNLTYDLNYRERGALAPLKLMSKMTRMTSSNRAYCGQYQVSGSMWTERNLEFSEVMYAGTLGMPYVKNLRQHVDYTKIQQSFDELCELNPRLREFNRPEVQQIYARFALAKVTQRGDPLPQGTWPMNYLMPMGDVVPNAADRILDDLTLGSIRDYDVKLKDHPDLLTLLFPYLYSNGEGYYRFVNESSNSRQMDNTRTTTFGKYVKHRLLMADRRFGRCAEFIFFCMDMLEKLKIHSYGRRVVPVVSGKTYTREDILLNGEYNPLHVSAVPHTIRSSYAYKRTHSLNLQAMFDTLGPPQVFLTLTCDDFAQEYVHLLEEEKPWADPILFALHFKRNMQEIITKYIRDGVCLKSLYIDYLISQCLLLVWSVAIF